jgi:hypothetical protein
MSMTGKSAAFGHAMARFARHAKARFARHTMAYPPLLFLFILALTSTARAQFPGADPDWPCAARLVPTLTPGAYWNGPVSANPAWRDDDKLFPLVTAIVDRDTPDAEATAKLTAYAATIPPASRPALFGAIVDQTNDERTLLINRIKQLGLRQRRMGDNIARLSTEIDTMLPTDSHRTELVGERDLDVQAFGETQRTMTYACEAPANMERRLGEFAKILQKQ